MITETKLPFCVADLAVLITINRIIKRFHQHKQLVINGEIITALTVIE